MIKLHLYYYMTSLCEYKYIGSGEFDDPPAVGDNCSITLEEKEIEVVIGERSGKQVLLYPKTLGNKITDQNTLLQKKLKRATHWLTEIERHGNPDSEYLSDMATDAIKEIEEMQ